MGVGCPWLRLTRTLPSAATLVAMSSTIGPPCPVGMPTEMGLVTMRPSAPPKGATMAPAPWPLTMVMPTMPRAAAMAGILAQASDVIAVVNPHRAHRLILGLVNRHFHGSRPRRLAVAPIGVQHHRCRRFLNHVQGRIRHAVALLHVAQVLRDADDPVGVVPHQVGGHQIAADQARFLLRGAGALEYARRRCFEFVRLQGWHAWGPSFDVSSGNESRVG